jgi:NAD(P)-dependent dehydrogenase (short-subunit alcohol dehydrogenase family)
MSEKQVALVTGTSSGIGLSTALTLAKAGYQVIATMRNTAKSDDLRQMAQANELDLDIQPLDVQDDASVKNAVEYAISTYGRIDLLVNNAGAGYVGTTEQTSIEDLRRVLDINLIGVWRMTSAVLPHMRAAKSGHLITVSSIGGVMGQPFNDAYCAAKFAIEGMMESLAPVVSGMGIHVSVIEPGAVLTKFVENVGGKVQGGKLTHNEDAYAQPLDAYIQGVLSSINNTGQTADDIAEVILTAAQAERPHFRYQTSERIQGIVGSKFADPTGDGQINQASKLLWP